MGDFILGHDDQGYLAAYSGVTWQADLDEQMLNNKLLTAVARSAAPDTTSMTLDVTFASKSDIKVLGIINHNLTATATYQWLAYNDSGRTTVIYDSGALVVGAIFDKLQSKVNVDAITETSTRWWRLVINDGSNTDGYLQIGRLFMGERFYPGRNMDYGLKIGLENDTTKIVTSESGVDSYIDYKKKRNASFSFKMTDYTKSDTFFKMELSNGLSDLLVFKFDSADNNDGLKTFACRQKTLSPLDYNNFNVNDFNINLIEVI